MRKRIVKVFGKVWLCTAICMLYTAIQVEAYSCGEKEGKVLIDGHVCCEKYHTFGHNKFLTTLSGGDVGVRYISIDSGFSTEAEKTIKGAINKWNKWIESECANKGFYLMKRSNNQQIKVISSVLENNTKGYTRFYKSGGGEITANSEKGTLPSAYAQAVVYIDTSKGQLKRTVSHELGHAMGLSHRICNKKSIMYNYMSDIEVKTPQRIDAKTIHHIYC